MVPAERSMPLWNPSPSLTGTSLYCVIAVMFSSRVCNKASPSLHLAKHLKCSETGLHWCCSQLYSLPEFLVFCRWRPSHPKLAGQYAWSRWTSFLSISNKSNSILQEWVEIPINSCREIEIDLLPCSAQLVNYFDHSSLKDALHLFLIIFCL